MVLRSLKNGLVALLVGILATGPAQAGKISSYSSGAPLVATDKTLLARGSSNVSGTVGDIQAFLKDKDNEFVTTHKTCDQSVTADVQAFLEAHNGVAVFPAGCYLYSTALTKTTTPTQLVLRAKGDGPVVFRHPNTASAILVDNTAAASSEVGISAYNSVLDNLDDQIGELTLSALPTDGSGNTVKRGDYCFAYSRDMRPGQDVYYINGITQANPAVVTGRGSISTSDIDNDSAVRIQYAKGMTAINGFYVAENRTATTAGAGGVQASTSFNLYPGHYATISNASPAVVTFNQVMPSGANGIGNGTRVNVKNMSGLTNPSGGDLLSKVNGKTFVASNVTVDGSKTTLNLSPIVTVTAVTNASPAHMTVAGSGVVTNGMQLVISGVSGMTELNGNTYTVSNKATVGGNTEFDLKNTAGTSFIDSTGYGAYASGGSAVTNGALDLSAASSSATKGVVFSTTALDTSNTTTYPAYTSGGYLGGDFGVIGEGLQVMEADSIPTPKVRMYGKLVYRNFLQTLPKLRCLDNTYKVDISGLSFEPDGDSSDASITTRNPAVKLMGLVNPVARNLKFKSPWAAALWVQATAGGRFSDIEANLGINNPVAKQFTYLGYTYGPNYGNQFINLTMHQGRHAGTTDGRANGSMVDSWYNLGVPKFNHYSNLTCIDNDGSCADDHPEGIYNSYDGVTCLYPQRGSTPTTGTIKGSCVQSRSLFPTYRNIAQFGGSRVLSMTGIDHGIQNEIAFSDITVKDTQAPEDAYGRITDYVLEEDSQAGVQFPDVVRISNLRSYGVGTLFYLNDRTNVIVNGLNVWGARTIANIQGSGRIEISGSQLYDFRDNPNQSSVPTNPHTIVNFKGNSVTGEGGTAILLSKPIIMKGPTDYSPREIFSVDSQAGAGPTYSYYLNDDHWTEQKIAGSSVADTLEVKAGLAAGIMNKLTNVKTLGNGASINTTNNIVTSAQVWADKLCNEAGGNCIDPDTMNASNQCFPVALTTPDGALSTVTSADSFRMPYPFVVTGVRAGVRTAGTTSKPTFDIRKNGASILSTPITIDTGALGSKTATVPPVIATTSLAEDDVISFDMTADTGKTASGAKVWLCGHQ